MTDKELEVRCRLVAIIDALHFLKNRARDAADELVHSDEAKHAAIVRRLDDAFMTEAEDLMERAADIRRKFGDDIRADEDFSKTLQKFWNL